MTDVAVSGRIDFLCSPERIKSLETWCPTYNRNMTLASWRDNSLGRLAGCWSTVGSALARLWKVVRTVSM